MRKIYKQSTYMDCYVNNKYILDKEQLKLIYQTLTYSRDNIERPYAIKIIIGLIDSTTISISKLTRSIKLKFKETGYAMAYSFEYAEKKKDHLEIMFIFNRKFYQPKSAYNLFYLAVHKLDGINSYVNEKGHMTYSIQCFDTWDNKTGHNLKNEEEFKDAMTRYSYICKQDDKEKVQRKKKFGTVKG